MREKIVVGQIYHVLNRGVDKRKIFLNDEDRFRFIHDLYEFNDEAPANNIKYFFEKLTASKSMAFARPYMDGAKKPKKLLVEILTFCLMPNHYHLLLRPRVNGGLVKFMKKLNMGYALYFNEKYERMGALFEGRYKSVPVISESHFIHLPYYIHLNPLDLISPEWRDRRLYDYKKALNFLSSYRWSSHLDYTGKHNFPSVTRRDFLQEILGDPQTYIKNIKGWLRDLDLEALHDVSLESI